MEEKDYYKLAYDLWYWLFQNPGKEKRESPYWNDIKGMKAFCPLCEIAKSVSCLGCIGDSDRECFGQAYELWFAGGDNKPYAAHIAFTIRKHMIKKGWYKKEVSQ